VGALLAAVPEGVGLSPLELLEAGHAPLPVTPEPADGGGVPAGRVGGDLVGLGWW
jgi:hypothetical protein